MTLLLVGAAAAMLLMLMLWVIHFPLHNAAIVDAGWAGSLAILGVIYGIGGDGWPARKILIAAMALIWGLRLAIYLLRTRVVGHPEEGRYVELRRKWKTSLGVKFLVFFEFQAVVSLILSAPFFLASMNRAAEFHWIEIAAVVVWAAGLAGESIADRQLAAFKRNAANRGQTCRAGLWRYSRHPNYFFEWLIWVGFGLVALPSPHGWMGLLSPVIILYFLLRVTGIPPTEKQALRTKGEDYREYQRTTSAFVPWFPKESRGVASGATTGSGR